MLTPIFLSPLFLIGMLTAAIPLIIHLSRSRRTKKMRFSTTRFFTDQFLRSYRMSKLKEILLLITRMAVCALLAVALAKPLLLPNKQSFLMRGSRSVVIVLDNSASMGVKENGVTLFDRARQSARELVEGLGVHDTATVVLAGRREVGPEVLFSKPLSDRDEIRKGVEAQEVSSLGTDLTAALTRAEEIARGQTEANKEIYVLSDLQDSGWELRGEDSPLKGDSDVLLFFVKIKPKSVANVGITAVQYGASRPMVGVPFSILPVVASQGEQSRNTDVRLYVDGEKVSEKPLEKLADGRWVFPRFYHTFAKGGWHSGYVEIDDEGLAQDNRRYFSFEVLEAVKMLAVNGASSEIPRLDELFFLKSALVPNPATGDSPIQLRTISPAEVSNATLADFPLVILANVEKLSEEAVAKLEDFVDQGGNLLVFLGDKVDPAFYNQTLAGGPRLHGGLLPGRLTSLKGNPNKTDGFATVTDVAYGHNALSFFKDAKAGLGGVIFNALWEVEPSQESAILMRAGKAAADNKDETRASFPLLSEKNFGKGRVLLFASTCDRDWTNFPARPTFLPWIYCVTGYLAQKHSDRSGFYLTGNNIPVSVSATEGLPRVQVKKPDGTTSYAQRTEDPDVPFAFHDTAQAGIYRVTGQNGESAQLFAVNLDGYESDLTYLDDVLAEKGDQKSASRDEKIQEGFQELLGGRKLVAYVDDPDRLADASLGARRGIKLWDIVLGIVLILALFEPWLANWISMKHYAKPKEVTEAVSPREGRWGRVAPLPGMEQEPEKVKI